MLFNIKDILPATTERVAKCTCGKTNNEIRKLTLQRLRFYKNCGRKTLTQRINELNREWNIERVIETNAALAVLISSFFGYKKRKHCCFFMTGIVGFFLLQHALHGWCPSLPIMRYIGIRTDEEIYNEKSIIKRIRGDHLHDTKDVEKMLVEAEKK